ncbi:MAG TPA: mercury resistance system periplasmic binding protein MerP [Gammaproteobacteria bacterium]|nr:mercury resistance system periplasmic binding protein MerP [Gammaproteobacteria bacterium]
MKRFIVPIAFSVSMLSATMGFAAEKTVTLAVKNMYCASCPYIVKKSLMGISGVDKVDVSFEKKIAIVSFEDTKTNVEALTKATTNAGYPSKIVQ